MLTVVIQAGGESQRMGRDKALVPFLGQPLVARVIARVGHLADEVIVTTNRPQALSFLELPLFEDVLPGRGALGGLYTALQAARHPQVAVVACDMPFVNPDLLAYARELLTRTPGAAVIPRTDYGTEPFHALYQREVCLPAIEAALEADLWRVDAWFKGVDIRFITGETLKKLDPHNLAFLNVNTPEELQRAEALAREIDSP